MLPKAYIFLIIISLITISIAGCQTASDDLHEEADQTDPDISQDVEEYEQTDNHAGNQINGGYIAEHEGWLYYSNLKDGGKIYKVQINGGEHFKINDDYSIKITVEGDWIYYLSIERASYTSGDIYKVRTDGSERTLLGWSSELLLFDGWIYNKGYSGIRKFRTDGTGHQYLIIRRIPAHFFIIYDGWLYYIDGYELYHYGPEAGPIYRIGIDGGEVFDVVDNSVYTFNIVGDWIYYSSQFPSRNIKRVRTDGTKDAILVDDMAPEIIVSGGWLFYINGDDNNSIYKVQTNGSSRTKLNDDASSNIIVVDDWLYYKLDERDEEGNIISNDNIYRMRFDGSEQGEFEMAEPEEGVVSQEQYYVAVDIGNNLFLRKTHGVDDKTAAEIIARLPRGTTLNVIDKHDNQIYADGYIWWEVSDPLSGKKGWVAAKYLRRNLPEKEIGFESTYDNDSGSSNLERRGNTVGNIANGGEFAENDGWLYYSVSIWNEEMQIAVSGQIYRVLLDGKSKAEPICNHRGSNFNVLDGWIYITDDEDFDKIFRMRADGSDCTKISTIYDSAADLNVVGDWVYYLNYTDDNRRHSDRSRIFKMRTDGSDRTLLADTYSYGLNVVGDWIYYGNVDDSNNIYKMRTDGSEKTKINNDASGNINVVDDWIYYSNGSDGFKIYKIRTDGSARTKLSDDVPGDLNVTGEWIYYSNYTDNSTIYKIRTDGSGRAQLNNEWSRGLHIINGWLFYNSYYKMRLDGSEQQRID
jgi:hypothetical protein